MKINVAIHAAAVQHRLQHNEGITFKGSGEPVRNFVCEA